MPDALPEIREADAPPAIAMIYAEIRRAFRIPLVNLIYRHLATIPGALPWAWGILQNPVTSGSLDEARQRITALQPTLETSTLTAAPGSAEIDGPATTEIATLLDVYDRSNLLNLIGLTAVRKVIEGGLAGELGELPFGRSDTAEVPHEDSVLAIPPLPKLAELPHGSAGLVRALAACHGGHASGVVPSLYLHLAHWPVILAAARDRLPPLFADGSLARDRDAICRLTEIEAAALLPQMRGAAPPAQAVPAMRRALDTFTRGVIPEMIVIGAALRPLLVPARADGA